MKKRKNEDDLTPITHSPSPSMPDMQKSRDTRRIAIDKVGVKDISYPIVVMDKNKTFQQTVARVNMFVNLPITSRGPT